MGAGAATGMDLEHITGEEMEAMGDQQLKKVISGAISNARSTEVLKVQLRELQRLAKSAKCGSDGRLWLEVQVDTVQDKLSEALWSARKFSSGVLSPVAEEEDEGVCDACEGEQAAQ